jgi:phosphomannomutase
MVIKKSDMIRRVNACFRRNDLRCLYGKEIDETLTHFLGRALVSFFKCKKVVVGQDMRTSSPSLCDSLIKGIRESGASVLYLGKVDTPALYFASGSLKLPGVMITASHNPKNYNGFKIVGMGAKSISEKTGLHEIKRRILRKDFIKSKRVGKLVKKDITGEYKKYLQSYISKEKLSGLKVVVDAGNGMAGKMAPIVYSGLPIKIVKMYYKLDGNFPNHVPNPTISKNLRDLQKRVLREKANLGIAFDGDMDRVVFVDDKGRAISSSITASLLINHLLGKVKGNKKVVYALVMSQLVPESVIKAGGKPVRERVGHAYMKERMLKENAVFGCEHSGHFYYKKNYFADSGFITSLLFLELVSSMKRNGKKISAVVDSLTGGHFKVEERSLSVIDKKGAIARIESIYKKRGDFQKIDKLDGLTMRFDSFWFNVRPSGTEPLLRVNLEAFDALTSKVEIEKLLRLVKK